MTQSLYPDIPEHLAGAVLSIDLDALTDNYKILCARLGQSECAAVIKADAYGLGSERVGPALEAAGCKVFFVAHINEGIRLRAALPDSEIHILNGLIRASEKDLIAHNLIPTLGSLEEIKCWNSFCREQQHPCNVHFDTGMLRLGLPPDEVARLASDPALIRNLDIRFIISHLASADEPQSNQNREQLAAYKKLRTLFPFGRASFCNSSGIFLGTDFHFDLARPGIALYGVNPTPGHPNPMRTVISLKARIIQTRNADAPQSVGYSSTHVLGKPTRIATVAVGYADGIPLSLSNNSCGYIGPHRIPLIGRVSMDLITFDVSAVPDRLCQPGHWIEMIGPKHTVDDMARDAGTIGYEILTSLGRRYHRVYKESQECL